MIRAMARGPMALAARALGPSARALSAAGGAPAAPNYPTIEEARRLPRDHFELGNHTLLALAASGDQGAKEERLIREIMAVDGCSWDDAQPRFLEIERKSKEGRALTQLPFFAGIGLAWTAGVASFPLCFNLRAAEWFNTYYVTADTVEPEDLETWLEVGTWTWNWMEPPLGQASFFLLCLQYSRDQMKNIGMQTYTERVKDKRGAKLVEKFPQYNGIVVAEFGRTIMDSG